MLFCWYISPFVFRYLEPCMEYSRRQCKTTVPLPPTTMVQTVCNILDGVLPKVLNVLSTFAMLRPVLHQLCTNFAPTLHCDARRLCFHGAVDV